MAHPLFARLERQLALVKRELENVEEAARRFSSMKRLRGNLYHEWSHRASLADGVAAIYTGLESVLVAIAKEIDDYVPKGDATHDELVETMAVEVRGVRPAVLREATRELMHEARKFRHVARHKYALELKLGGVLENYRLARKLVPAFERDYCRFVAAMVGEDRAAGGKSSAKKGGT